MCKQDIQRCWNECSAWQIAGTEDSLQIFSGWQKLCDQPHLSMFSSLLHTQYLPLPGVWFSVKSAYSEMPPSFCVVGQLQASLVAPQQKAQIAKINNKNSLLDLLPWLFASSVTQEMPKWDTPLIFLNKNCVPPSNRKNDLLIYLTSR